MHAVVNDSDAPLCTLLRRHADEHEALVLRHHTDTIPLLRADALVPLLVLAARVYGGTGPFGPVFEGARPVAVRPRRPRLVVCLGSGMAEPAARDFAVKCQGTGFAPAWHSDPRNFAHSEFMALGDDLGEALVVCFAAGPERAYLDRFFAAFPSELPVVRVETPEEGTDAALALLARGIKTFERLAGPTVDLASLPAPPQWGLSIFQLAR